MPRYTHDCDDCKPLGEFGEYDLYFCYRQATGSTLLARYGNEGHEYTSGIEFVGYDNAITEAHHRAITNGYLTR